MQSKSSKNKTEPKAPKKPKEQDRIIVFSGASPYSALNYYGNHPAERKAAAARFRAGATPITTPTTTKKTKKK